MSVICVECDCTVFVIEGSVLCYGCPWDRWGFDCVVYVWYDISCTREQQQSFYLFRDLHVIWGFQVNRRENPVLNGEIIRMVNVNGGLRLLRRRI